jgi:hypothetical protein
MHGQFHRDCVALLDRFEAAFSFLESLALVRNGAAMDGIHELSKH